MINALSNLDDRVRLAMAGREQEARASQIHGLRSKWAESGGNSQNVVNNVMERAGRDYNDEQQFQAAQYLMQNGSAADPLYAEAIAGTPQGVAGRMYGLMADDGVAGGIARGTLFGGGVTAGGAAMTAGAQKLMDLMGLFEEAEETEVARDQPLHS